MPGRGKNTPGTRRAFSLLEVLVAIAIVLALLGAMFAFLWNLLSTRDRVAEVTRKSRAATALVEHLETDLFAAIAGDDSAGAGVVGDASSLRILTRGVPARLSARGAGDGDVFADLEVADYRFDAAAARITAARSLAAPHRAEAARRFPLGEGIHLVRFRYHDGRGWRDSFDSGSADRLPAAVEVAIWFDPWPGAAGAEPADGAGAASGTPGQSPQRLTFDAEAGFDERAVALASDLDTFDEPRPDRLRIIVVPDADADAEEDSAGEVAP